MRNRHRRGPRLARFVHDHADDVLHAWVLEHRRKLALSAEALVDTIPALLTEVVAAAESIGEAATARLENVRAAATAHATNRKRARFRLQEVCDELALLRRTVLETFQRDHDSVSTDEILCLDAAFDAAVTASIVAFAVERDRTERIESDRNLLDAVIRQIPAGVLVVDATGKVMLSNPQCEEVLGVAVHPGDAAARARPERAFHADGSPYRAEDWPVTRSVRDGESVIGEFVEIEHPRRRRVFVRVSSCPVRDDADRGMAVLALLDDVSDVQEAERGRARLAAIVEAATDLVAIASEDGVISYLNEAGRVLLGLDRATDAIGHSIADFAPASERTRLQAEVVRALAAHERWSGEVEMRNVRTGTTWPCHCSVFAFAATGKGRDTDLAILGRDVSDERRRSDLERQLVGVVGHDLKNPLHAVLLSTDLLLRRQLEPDTRMLVEKIRTAGNRAVRMVFDILDFTQVRLGGGLPFRPQPVDLRAVVCSLIEELQTAFPGRALRFEHEGDTTGTWDGERLAQAVANLVVNAMKHGAAERPVTVRVRGSVDTVVIEVHNEGPVIPEAERACLFEPMRKGRSRGAGLGLGLYIVRHVVERHGGTIDVRSTAEEGTTFSVRLPRVAATEADQAPRRDSFAA